MRQAGQSANRVRGRGTVRPSALAEERRESQCANPLSAAGEETAARLGDSQRLSHGVQRVTARGHSSMGRAVELMRQRAVVAFGIGLEDIAAHLLRTSSRLNIWLASMVKAA